MKKVVYFLIWFSTLLSGCTDVFIPPTSGSKQILVVDGLITNIAENYNVRLSFANSYNSTGTVTPVTQAVVTINDDQGNTYLMQELGNGNYGSTPSGFTGVIRRTYTLHIKTSDGTTYQSTPQFMEQPFPIDSISGVMLNKPFVGVESYVNLNIPNGTAGNFRFTDSLLVEAVSEGIDHTIGPEPIAFFSWYYVGVDEVYNITASGFSTNTFGIVDHELCYFPIIQSFYYIPDSQSINKWILIVRAYAINDDTYNIYNLMNEQLSAGNQLFDPVVTQVKGNMICTSNTDITVLGKFEASSYIQSSYIVVPNIYNGKAQYSMIRNLGTIPKYHLPVPQYPPSFWQ